jgi:hypothetical protein
MNWIQKNFKTIIYISFLIPILLVALVSISHVTTWYGISNPITWAVYLSIGIEIAALSALAAISVQMGSRVYLPFGVVTLIQFIGNIFFAYQYIDADSEQFKDWVDLVEPVVSYLGVEPGNIISHKRFLALFSGGMLPIISLSFLHMLVKFEEDDKQKKTQEINEFNIEDFSKEVARKEAQEIEEKYTPTDEELKKLEEELIRLSESKFGKLTETPIDEPMEMPIDEPMEMPIDEPMEMPIDEPMEMPIEEQKIEILIEEEIPKNEMVSLENEDNNQNSNENVITEVEIEPDFYKEDEPDYHIVDDNKNGQDIKTLKYFRPH